MAFPPNHASIADPEPVTFISVSMMLCHVFFTAVRYCVLPVSR